MRSSDPSACDTALRSLIKKQRTGRSRSNEGWFDLYRHLTNTVIQDAFDKQPQVARLLAPVLDAQQPRIHYDFHHRKVAKSFSRVSGEFRAYRKSGSSLEQAALRVNSDLVVMRIVVPSLKDIVAVVKCLETEFSKDDATGNFIIQHATSGQASQNVDHRYLKVYLARVGYVVGIQVGLVFTFYVFSHLASTTYRPDPTGQVVRLWKFCRAVKANWSNKHSVDHLRTETWHKP